MTAAPAAAAGAVFFRYDVEYCVHSNTKMLNLETKTRPRPRRQRSPVAKMS